MWRDRREGMNTTTMQSPRPLPLFSTNASFSQRKKTPLRTPRPPKPPIKSCPPVSRIFRSPESLNQPHVVSFKPERDDGMSQCSCICHLIHQTLQYSSRRCTILPHDNCTLSRYSSSSDIHSFIMWFQCFVIKEKLGAGAFGEVYKVESKEDGKIYAVKRSSQRFRGEWDRLVVEMIRPYAM